MNNATGCGLTIVTAEGAFAVDPQDPSGINAAVTAIMNAQAGRGLDEVDPSTLSVEDLLCRELHQLAEQVGRVTGRVTDDATAWSLRKYGADFKNEVFEMHPYWWGECRCSFEAEVDAWYAEQTHPQDDDEAGWQAFGKGYQERFGDREHAEDCPEHPTNTRRGLPNFQYGDIEIRWYKYIGRGMQTSRELTREDIEKMIAACRASLG